MTVPLSDLNPSQHALPTRQQLIDLRIWDLHYHGLSRHEEVMDYVERMGVERLLSLGIGTVWHADPQERRRAEQAALQRLEAAKDRVFGIVVIEPAYVDRSLELIDRWIRNGPCIGIKYSGGRGGVTCSHPNNDPIVRAVADLSGVIYIHTWTKVGGTPRFPGGGNNPGESSPEDVAILSQRFPDVPMICGHSGGDWELAARVVRPHPNVYFEFSGSDPHSGSVDYAVKELGAERIVWGGHGPSRSYATEISKVLDADLTQAQQKMVFGENLRRLAAPILRNKGIRVTV